MKAQFPKGAGLWPACWLMPADLSWPPELDVVEALMQKPRVVYTTAHDASYKTTTNPPSSQMAFATNTADLSLEPHEFGVDWGPTKLRWYLDRKLIFSLPTPLDYNRPMYWIVNLAVGGPKSWAGAPDSTTVFPAHMQVFAVEAWQRKAYLP
jgi:beta-glucanase (GH16 family)